MPGHIRSVTLEDAAAIQAIYAPFVTDTMISFEMNPPTVVEMAARIEKTLGKFPWLVYEVKGANGSAPVIAGYVYASYHSERAAYQWSVNVSVYVEPRFQRRSIGRGLYTALFELLRAQGFVNAYAGISLPNTGSVGIHEALGFELVGIYRQVGYKFGSWHDVGWWGLQLAEPPLTPAAPRPSSELAGSAVWADAIQRGLALIPVMDY